jgi:hypothetical protein
MVARVTLLVLYPEVLQVVMASCSSDLLGVRLKSQGLTVFAELLPST